MLVADSERAFTEMAPGMQYIQYIQYMPYGSSQSEVLVG